MEGPNLDLASVPPSPALLGGRLVPPDLPSPMRSVPRSPATNRTPLPGYATLESSRLSPGEKNHHCHSILCFYFVVSEAGRASFIRLTT